MAKDIRKAIEKSAPGSKKTYERSSKVLAQEIVGTVNFSYPIYIKEAHGSRVTDVDGNEYIDLTMGFGPHILGHAPKVVLDALREALDRGVQWGLHNPYQEPLASLLVDAVPCADKVVFCNTGTEASMYCIRAARAFSGKSKIAMFEGGFHGAHDAVLVKVDPSSPVDRPTYYTMGQGIPKETLANTMMLPYLNDAAFDLIRKHKKELALVMVEPVQGSNPRLDQGEFLKELAEVCRESEVLLMFDEVITGFRMAYGGAQEFFGVTPDMAIYGKAPGGGMPLGVVAGRGDVMEVFTRQFDIYRDDRTGGPSIFTAGTFSGNPMTMAAGTAVLTYLRDHKGVYKHLAEQGTRLADEVNRFFIKEELPGQMANALSMFYLRVQPGPMVRTARDIDRSMKAADDLVTLHMLQHGVLVPPVHLAYISAAHTVKDVDTVVDAIKESFLEVRQQGHI